MRLRKPKKHEYDQIQNEKSDAEKKIAEAKDLKERVERKIDETTKHLKLEKEGLLKLEECLNQTKTNLALEQKKITQEKLEIEKEK